MTGSFHRGYWVLQCVCVCLADRLQLGPGVRPAHLQRHVVVEDVVAQILQGRLWVRSGELSRLLHLLTDCHVNFLPGAETTRISSVVFKHKDAAWVYLRHHFLSKQRSGRRGVRVRCVRSPLTPPQMPCCCQACGPSAWRWGHFYCGLPGFPHVCGSYRK